MNYNYLSKEKHENKHGDNEGLNPKINKTLLGFEIKF
jgi:hypothetical protein